MVNLIDVTLVCEDGSSKLVEVAYVVDVDDENNTDEAQGLVKILKLKLKFMQDFGAGICSAFCC